MKKTSLLVCLFLTFYVVTPAQYLQWANGIGGTGDDGIGPIAVDGSGNVYIAGLFSDSVDFDPGPAAAVLVSSGIFDGFIAKYGSNGTFRWAKPISGVSLESITAMVLDQSGNLYLAGEYSPDTDLDPGPGTFFLSSVGGILDLFIAKYDSEGQFIWAKGITGSGTVRCHDMVMDNHGNIYVSGDFTATADFDPSSGTANLTADPMSTHTFFAKYNSAGNYVWAKKIGQSDYSQKSSIGVDQQGNVFLTGDFQGTADFDPGHATANLISQGSNDIFLAKYDPNGAYQWAISMGSSGGEDRGKSLAIDVSGNVYVTGHFYQNVDFDPSAGQFFLISSGFMDAFLAKYNTNGNLIWAKDIGGLSDETGNSLKASGNGEVYLTGSFAGTCDFDPSGNVHYRTSAGSDDIYFAKYNAQGALVWVSSMGGPGSDAGLGIFANGSPNLYLAGNYRDTADFDPGAGYMHLSHVGGIDGFFAKFGNSPLNASDEHSTVFAIDAYPNPTRGIIHLSSPATATISTLTGQHLFTRVQASELDLSGLPSGMYLLTLQNKQRTVVKKVVIEE